uniref:Uncharacterized protein n=1 Tax=Anopheles melas TaxID=34690 RepID=A0A182U0E6_9DIPT
MRPVAELRSDRDGFFAAKRTPEAIDFRYHFLFQPSSPGGQKPSERIERKEIIEHIVIAGVRFLASTLAPRGGWFAGRSRCRKPLDATHRLWAMRVVRPSYGLTPERWLPVDDLRCAHQRRDQLPQIVPNATELMLNVVKQGRESDQTDTTPLFTKLHHWRQRKRLALLNHRKEC